MKKVHWNNLNNSWESILLWKVDIQDSITETNLPKYFSDEEQKCLYAIYKTYLRNLQEVIQIKLG